MSKIIWTKEAQHDLESIYTFIARDSPSAAARFVGKLARSTRRLAKFPMLGTSIPELSTDEFRQIPYGNYRIICRAKSDAIEVIAVYHAARLLDSSIIPAEE